jgi:type IV pilus assembly protein PilY1
MKGWYVDFADSEHTGERSVTNPAVESGKLFFNTLILSTKQCGTGSGNSYVLDALTGLSAGGKHASDISQIGVLTMPLILQIQAQTEAGRNDKSLAGGSGAKKDIVVNLGSGGSFGTISKSNGGTDALSHVATPFGNFGWREILNWQELHDAASSR